ncbi:uncharacterized protein MONOS_6136 [Monocercomonoides exilis]|uniref:uncharacterized protein n=1 Tax=Monocercomonoides exilis TaxID=2049356 RepID=UPI00355AC862|nr:hypothetical protein MONOS_6136 [Monocercomonoides exilis]|eukprot:MONOS_6136.1-p1 / transcript=MONOS_6136.1 / gene=MONOS_6136 / organism=Monocercomonoides_exilis_PA203 / gene_product=unspecified product / transcript_product=unspecified product / location=Mono_scaffold00189:60340-61366(+) / protein_length=320 / sequence_SO=supercontig / SO=protein_coding / is_pseudo=false
MISEEDKKKEEKDEKLLVDLCECLLTLSISPLSNFHSICVPSLLKVALKKDEDKEAQKGVEMALLALNCIDEFDKIEKELYLNEIKEIIQYHQEHHNLTQFAYQSAWRFLIRRLKWTESLEMDIANELHLAREAARELEELTKSMDWRKKEDEKEGTERKTMNIISRWISSIGHYLNKCHLWNEEYVDLISRIVDVLRASRDNHSEIGEECIRLFNTVAKNRAVKVEDLLKSGAIDAVLEEINRPILDRIITFECKKFFQLISVCLKRKEIDEKEEAKRKAIKMELFEKLEEEGYEDIIASFHEKFSYIFADHNVFIYL